MLLEFCNFLFHIVSFILKINWYLEKTKKNPPGSTPGGSYSATNQLVVIEVDKLHEMIISSLCFFFVSLKENISSCWELTCES